MSEWAAKRFWKDSAVAPQDAGFVITLDGRVLKTPAKAALVVPTRALAEAIAAEWEAQEGLITPRSMPMTRAANAAVDKVSVQFAQVADMLADYGGSDLLCYRAETPEALVARQAAAWDPLLDWAARDLGAKLNTTRGVMHLPQPEASIQALRTCVHGYAPFALTALHDLVVLPGSLIIGLAAYMRAFPAEQLWEVACVDEDWQAEQWGLDDEAQEAAQAKRQSFMDALRLRDLLA